MSRQITEFAMSNPIFLVSLILSCILLVGIVVLAIGGLSEKWEKRCGKALIFTTMPVIVWMIYFFRPAFNPIYITIISWLVVLGVFGLRKANDSLNEMKYLDRNSSWRCPKCKAINELVYIVCKECNEPQPKQKQ